MGSGATPHRLAGRSAANAAGYWQCCGQRIVVQVAGEGKGAIRHLLGRVSRAEMQNERCEGVLGWDT